VWSGVLLGGCAAIAGLDQIQETECAPNCDGGTVDAVVDHTVDSPPMGDDSGFDATQDTTGDDGSPPEASSDDSSTGNDASDGGTDVDGQADSGSDAHAGDGGVDASDSGCVLGNAQNCGVCGRACSSAGASTTTCSANGTCSPTCKSGYLSCSNPASPTADNGCECAVPNATGTPACCGTSCPTQHSYDVDIAPTSDFYDCVAAGKYNQTLAMDACTAFTGDATQCDYMGAMWSCTYGDGGLAGYMVCADGPKIAKCQCWGYSDAVQGYMVVGTGNGQTNQQNCLCPGPGNTQWN